VARVGYRFAGEIERTAPTSNAPSVRPTVLVQAFVDVTGEQNGVSLVAGITEDIVAALSRFRWFAVARQGTDASYVLSGSVRKSEARVRISAQLLSSATGTHLWAEKYDIETTDLFALQDELAARVAGAIEPSCCDRRPHGRSATGRRATWCARARCFFIGSRATRTSRRGHCFDRPAIWSPLSPRRTSGSHV